MAKKGIVDTCKGFFEDHRHLKSHFGDLTDSAPLNQNVEEHLPNFISEILLQFLYKSYKFMFRKFGNVLERDEQVDRAQEEDGRCHARLSDGVPGFNYVKGSSHSGNIK